MDLTALSASLRTLPPSQPLRLIDENGLRTDAEASAGFPLPSTEILLGLYRKMVIARRFDLQVTALTRQGRLATYPSALGQEACEIAAVAALDADDWLFPTYRDSIALLTRGVAPEHILASFRGDWHSGYDNYEHRIAPQATPLATQALHAVGLATASKLKRDKTVALTFLGDGATSEGDAHEAFNFAAVWQAPVVFVVQNNQFAISVPLDKQMHCQMIADKAVGYGMPGYFVDGNDVAAMYAIVTHAVQNARSGAGPTLIEGLTYRIEAHTNSDDPTRYRASSEVEEWKGRDPIARLEKYLLSEGALSDSERSDIDAAAEKLAAATRECMTREAEIDPLELFDHLYATPRPALAEQRQALADELTAHADAELSEAALSASATPAAAQAQAPAQTGAHS
ncbi:pyruvate dehydrogenase (acetyl-transferring) E1 component subunit alpha [Glaciibacter superstes]|uniref:pyruvate dehydrogenase (acetyl-transferring) E1 component subunit alpha n=1 Tax=Glaciibacter superstes TaxID=501023 RepID=UPI000A03D1B5|nr:pyruvate dehydrogenase (acetyl-transferring) E1 component subunit alpha [Glaciibacter superstes]